MYVMSVMCGVQLKDRNRAMDLKLMLGWNEAIDLLTVVYSVHWHGHVLRRVDPHARKASHVDVGEYLCLENGARL